MCICSLLKWPQCVPDKYFVKGALLQETQGIVLIKLIIQLAWNKTARTSYAI